MTPSPAPPFLLLANYICHHVVVVIAFHFRSTLMPGEGVGGRMPRVSQVDGCLKVSMLDRSSVRETQNQNVLCPGACMPAVSPGEAFPRPPPDPCSWGLWGCASIWFGTNRDPEKEKSIPALCATSGDGKSSPHCNVALMYPEPCVHCFTCLLCRSPTLIRVPGT